MLLHSFIPNRRLLLAVLAGIAAVAIKFLLNSGQLLPGVDGPYYWVQVRSLLSGNGLAFDDLPLVFWMQALISYLVGNIELGVRISDAVLPALSALPIYALLKTTRQQWIPAFAILVVLLHPVQLFFFTGDFIKNAAAIPVLFFIGLLLFKWDQKPRRAWVVLLMMIVVGFSHYGTFITCLLMVSFWAIFYLRTKPLRFWIIASAGGAVFASLTLLVLTFLIPARLERLFEFVTHPSRVFEGPYWQLMFFLGNDTSIIFTMFIGQAASVTLGYILFRNRSKIENSKLSLVASSLTTAFILSSPLVGIEWASRFIALSFAPLLLASIVMVATLEVRSVMKSGVILGALVLASTIFLAPMGAKASAVSEAEYRDLQQASSQFVFPKNSIVIARHGLEYLVAWTMKTHVVQEETVLIEDLSSYDSVFLLTTDAPVNGYIYGEHGKVDFEKDLMPTSGSKSGSNGELVYSKGKVSITKIR